MAQNQNLKPSEIVALPDLAVANVDLGVAIKKYEETGKNFIAMGSFKNGSAPIKVLFRGELTTEGVLVSEFNKIPNYSFGFRFESADDLEAFDVYTELLDKFLKANGGSEYELSQIVKDDKLYIKLKVIDKKKFGILSNVKLDPKKLGDSGLYRGQGVTILGELGVYFNLLDKKAGITFSARRLTFDLDEQ